jgi:hypothetical protein
MKKSKPKSKIFRTAAAVFCLTMTAAMILKISPLLFYRIGGEVSVNGQLQSTSAIYRRLSNNDFAIRITSQGHPDWYLVKQGLSRMDGYSLYSLSTDEPNLCTVLEGNLDIAEDGGPYGYSMPGLFSKSNPRLQVNSDNVSFIDLAGERISFKCK